MSDDGSAYDEQTYSGPTTPTDEFELTTEQQQALTLDQNIAITAGAGTGKTTTLTERYRHILKEHPELSPTQIVTITFTRDATSEMRDKIRGVVDDALESAGAETYDRWQQAKDDIEDAYIHTIHGFCSRILEEYAVEASVHPDFETLDNGEAATLIDRTVRDVLAYVLDEATHLRTAEAIDARKSTLTDDVERLARLYSRDDLVGLLAGLLNERPESNQWANQLLETSHEEYVAAVFERACPLSPDDVSALLSQPAVCEALETIRELAANDYEFTDEPDDGIATLELLGPQLPDGPINGAETATYQQLFLDFCDQVTKGDGTLYARPTSYAGTASRWKSYDRTADHEALTAACETLIEALDPEDQDLSFDGAAIERSIPYVYAIARLYQTVREEYTRRKETQHALDYSDLIERTIAFLEIHDRARHELREQFEYLMVDEIQDTDPRQWELVALLTGSDEPGFDGQNVFLVGDEKQSIYRFRRADVTMFREARDRLEKANPESTETAQQLSGNFRTLSGPLTFINELFEEVFQPEGDEYQPYEARPQWLTPERSEGTEIDGTVEYLVVPETDQDVAPLGLENTWFDRRTYRSKGEREAYGVAARLTRLFDDPPRIYDPETDEYRAAQPRDVALLFRTRTRFPEFERAFEEYDIPYSSFGARGFYETAEIQPLVNLLKVLQDPTQDIPLYGVLRSPLFGLTDEQLAALYDSDECLWEQLATTDGTLETAYDQLKHWRSQAGLDGSDRITTWAALLSEIIDDTGYLISVGADERPEQAVVNVNKFREQLRTWEEGSALPLIEVIERIERERDQETDPGEATIPAAIDGVQLRTVHSAKGLEFPIVVVPELSRGVSKRSTITDNSSYSQSLAYLETEGDEPVLGIKGPSPANSFETAATPDYNIAGKVQQQELRAESRRLLYVATTRVRDHLMLTSTHAIGSDSEATFGEYDTGEDASCWRDLVQPILLEDRELLPELATAGDATRSLKEGQYTVRRPPTPVAGPAESASTERACDIELPEPPESSAGVALSATAVRDLVSDYTSHDESRTETEPEHSAFLTESSSKEGLAPTQFGTAVHRLCELSLAGSTIDWSAAPTQIVDTPDKLSPTVLKDLQNQVQYGVSDIEQLEATLPVEATYDEYQVRLELPSGQVVGDIDHLTVTDDCYYISDYKTDTLGDRDLETVAEHYFTQLYVYACALAQADSTRDCILRLIFTNAETTAERAVSEEDISEWRERFTRALTQESADRRPGE